jgi:FKBP-type peptidyl-prolyl cis-trans isomerase FkpA
VTDPIQKNIQDIEAYIKDNKLKAQKTASNLYYIVEKEGDGTHPQITDNVTVHYKGYFLDGSVFDSSYERGQPATFPLNRVVAGWQEGIPLFQRGGGGKLLIPSNLGYGSTPPPGIPANSVLIFDVEVLKINNQ